MFRKKTIWTTAALILAVSPHMALGQTPLLYEGLFPSADLAVAPTPAQTAPNGGQPIARIHAITGFGTVYGFGSSSTQTIVTPPNGNTPIQYEQQFSPLIGAVNTGGATFPPATNFAVAGTTSVTALPQVAQFQAAYGRYQPNDIVLQFSGINDFSTPSVGGIPQQLTTQAILNAVVAQDVSYQTQMVQQNLALGARNYLFLGLPDLGTFQFFTNPVINLFGFIIGGGDPALLTQGSAAVNAQMLTNLMTLHNQTGANIHYFDTNLFVNEIRANPTLYGFTAAGVAPGAACSPFFAPSACGSAPFNVQNQYLSYDGIHYTYRAQNLLALAITNQLLAPYTMAGQAEMAQGSAIAFADSLLGRLEANRYSNAYSGSPSNAYNAYNSYGMATKVLPRVQPVDPLAAWSIFAMGSYVHANQNDHLGAAGFDNDLGEGTVGFDYRWSPNLLLGGAFSYSDTSSNASLVGTTKTEVKSYQFAGFASANYTNWFSDLVLTYGLNDYNISRSGVVDLITASPHGNNFVAAWKAGYLFDTAMVRVGPVGGLTYSSVWIDAYNESGDPLLTQAVLKQNLEGLTGSAGVQFRLPIGAWNRVNPFLNLTVEHDFIGDARVITTAQTYSLGLPIATQITDGHSQTYGKVAGGANIDLGGRFSGLFNAETTFARQGGNWFAVTAGLNARL
jgi:outer membrane lipase/esterase